MYETRFEDVTKKLNKALAEHEFFYNLWSSVTFPTKKNGEPFAILSKNIEGARLETNPYSLQDNAKKVVVGGFCEGLGYISDDFNTYENVRYLKDPEKIAKKQNYGEKVAILEQPYYYDLDDIKAEVSKRAQYHKERAEAIRKQIKTAETAHRNFWTAYNEAIRKLEQESGKSEDSTLFYAILGN